MTRKQWINNITDEEAVKIHATFRQMDKGLFALPVMQQKTKGGTLKQTEAEFNAARRKAVRHFLRNNKLTKENVNSRYLQIQVKD